MRKIISICSALFIMLMSAVTFANVDISNGVVVAEGMGAAGQIATNGYRAAKVDAMRNLLEQVGSVRVDSQTIVRDSMNESDVIKTQISGFVKGAKVINQYQDSSGYFHVVVELPVYGETNSLASAVIPKKEKVDFPEPEVFAVPAQTSTTTVITSTTITTPGGSPVPSAPANNNAIYTGVIVDCQGLGLETAMAPGIFDPNHKVVYGLQNFSHDQIIAKGYVGYSKSVSSGVERAGSNPLIIKAVRVEGFCNPVISEADAVKLLQANKVSGFLNKANVVLVK